MSFTPTLDSLLLDELETIDHEGKMLDNKHIFRKIYDIMFKKEKDCENKVQIDKIEKAKNLLIKACIRRTFGNYTEIDSSEVSWTKEFHYIIPVLFTEKQVIYYLDEKIIKDYKRQYLWNYESEEQANYSVEDDKEIYELMFEKLKEKGNFFLATVLTTLGIEYSVNIYEKIAKNDYLML